jgi:flagellar FliL protein
MAKAEEKKVEEGQEEVAKSKFPMWVILLIAAQVFIGGAVIAVFVFLSGDKSSDVVQEMTVAEQRIEPAQVRDPASLMGPQFDLDPFIVNLIDDGRGPRYLKIEIKFELESAEVRPEVQTRLAQIRDEMLMLLSSKRFTDIESADGKRLLKNEIFTRINRILVTGRIKRVFLTDFVIQ